MTTNTSELIARLDLIDCACEASDLSSDIDEHRQDCPRQVALDAVARLSALDREAAASTNYVADDDTFPASLTFANGRHVEVRSRPDGSPYLVVGWALANQTVRP